MSPFSFFLCLFQKSFFDGISITFSFFSFFMFFIFSFLSFVSFSFFPFFQFFLPCFVFFLAFYLFIFSFFVHFIIFWFLNVFSFLFSFFPKKKASSFLFSFKYISLLTSVSEFHFRRFLRCRCSLEMWCPDVVGRDTWDWVGPPTQERTWFKSPEWCGGSSPVETEPPQLVLLLFFRTRQIYACQIIPGACLLCDTAPKITQLKLLITSMISLIIWGTGMATICSSSKVTISPMIWSTGMSARSTVLCARTQWSQERQLTRRTAAVNLHGFRHRCTAGTCLGAHRNVHHSVDEQSMKFLHCSLHENINGTCLCCQTSMSITLSIYLV